MLLQTLKEISFSYLSHFHPQTLSHYKLNTSNHASGVIVEISGGIAIDILVNDLNYLDVV